MNRLEAELAAYYDQEAQTRATRDLDPERLRRRRWFMSLLRAEERSRVLEVGTGPGRDAAAFAAEGFAVAGVDLSPANISLCRAAGVDAQVASIHQLPYDDDSFDAGWTMSTLVHVADNVFDDAVRELRRVLVPGAPLAVGLGVEWTEKGPSSTTRSARRGSSASGRTSERARCSPGTDASSGSRPGA